MNYNKINDHLRNGGIIAFPTDTVPALACLPQYADAIYQLKQRDHRKPLILMVSDISECIGFIKEDTRNQCTEKASTVWPGAVTLVLPISHHARSVVQDGQITLGIRIPDNHQALQLLSNTGPLLTTSCNRSGMNPLRDISEIKETFPNILVLEEQWSRGSGTPSDVLKYENEKWEILRHIEPRSPNVSETVVDESNSE